MGADVSGLDRPPAGASVAVTPDLFGWFADHEPSWVFDEST
jgi:hypothetical protein